MEVISMTLEIAYVSTIAEAVVASDTTESVLNMRLSGLNSLMGMMKEYAKQHFDESVIAAAFSEKAAFVLKAKTKGEMKEILKPSTPRYTGGSFGKGSYHSEAEELMLWSTTSLRGPLIAPARARYMELFDKYFSGIREGS
jgi:hypothetical protein